MSTSSPKYVFVTGGVTSSLGKGIISASLGLLLKAGGWRVTIQKFDPYINVDPGTMNPYEHGECFVTSDGAETDLDLGHYERFLGIHTSKENNVTTGRIYYELISKERKGDFLGKTVQVIPHVTDEIKKNIYKLGKTGDYDIIITEIGGCVGDIESLPFIESIRQLRLEKGPHTSAFIHLTLVPYLASSGELKTKPTQQSVKELLSLGIQPDVLLCRSAFSLPKELREKIALHCNLSIKNVIEAIDVANICEMPVLMHKEQLEKRVLSTLALPTDKKVDLRHWHSFLKNFSSCTHLIRVGLVGKYTAMRDAYISIQEALTHAGVHQHCKVVIERISSEEIENTADAERLLGMLHAIVIAPGFGKRGVQGKMIASMYAKEKEIPCLGICLGMQCVVISFARDVLGLKDADSTEFTSDTPHPVIDLMETQKKTPLQRGYYAFGSIFVCAERK